MIVPYKNSPEGKKKQVAVMFDKIAARYDILNHILSFNVDKHWRRVAIRIMEKYKPEIILDIATGTGDFAIAAAKQFNAVITGVDISAGMLEVARNKIKKLKLNGQIIVIQADSEQLPFQDGEFDSAMAAFGVRNFENLVIGLKEVYRVISERGAFVMLEFSKPEKIPFRYLYDFYFRNILPVLGRLISGDPSAYRYLPESVSTFPKGADMIQILVDCGFRNCYVKRLSFGIASIYVGEKV